MTESPKWAKITFGVADLLVTQTDEVHLMAKTVTIQGQQRWDYRCETRRTDSSLLTTLNEIGQAGWELVSVQHHKDPKGEMAWTAFLKRPSVSQAAVAGQSSQALAGTGQQHQQQQPTEKSEFRGFDLSGNEFEIKKE